jgi:CRP/FNR family transcriptional regulator, cyclic AMP receptor protein
MSVALRNLEEPDVQPTLDLISGLVEAGLVKSPFLQPDVFKKIMLAETTFGLVAEDDGKIVGTASIIMEQETSETVLGLLCRICVSDGPERGVVSTNLVQTALASLGGNLQLCYAEVPTTDLWAQAACEQSGFIPCGFLPQKFAGEPRTGAIVYAHLTELARNSRRPHAEIISDVRDLASEAMKSIGMIEDFGSRDDIVAYPVECGFDFAPIDADVVQTMLQTATPLESETFRLLQGSQTRLCMTVNPTQYMAAKDGERIVGVIGYILDAYDKRVQITDIIVMDEEPAGFMVAQLLETLKQQHSPEYWEVMVSARAPRMQKTFDQLGFVPCAYIPAFGMEHGLRSDAIKMVKLSGGYESDPSELTSAGRNIFNIIDTIFREHSVGTAVIKLLQDLRIFRGMGEGELRRVARLFSQKLWRPGDVVFEEGSTGRELYVVERGEIEICTKDGNKLLGTIRNGAILGEIAFLNGEPRTARAVSKSATIVRVIHRADFDKLIQREVHLGLVFFQNVALDLAEKLKKSVVLSKAK